MGFTKGNVIRLADAPVAYGTNGTLTVADPNSGNLLLFPKTTPGKFYEHVFSNNTWVIHNLPPGISIANASGSGMPTVAAPIPELGVIMFIKADWGNSAVYLYKHQP